MRTTTRAILIIMPLLFGSAWAASPGAIEPADLAARLASGDIPTLLDVRTPAEYAGGHIAGAVNIAHSELATRLDELTFDKHREVIVYCRTGGRARQAADVLLGAGYDNVRVLTGHVLQWQAEQRPLVGAVVGGP